MLAFSLIFLTIGLPFFVFRKKVDEPRVIRLTTTFVIVGTCNGLLYIASYFVPFLKTNGVSIEAGLAMVIITVSWAEFTYRQIKKQKM